MPRYSHDRQQVKQDFESMAATIRTHAPVSINAARTATELIIFAQAERQKAADCEKAIERLGWTSRPRMVDGLFSVFYRRHDRDENDEAEFTYKETQVLIEALELVKGGHITNAELAESMVTVTTPEIEEGKK